MLKITYYRDYARFLTFEGEIKQLQYPLYLRTVMIVSPKQLRQGTFLPQIFEHICRNDDSAAAVL